MSRAGRREHLHQLLPIRYRLRPEEAAHALTEIHHRQQQVINLAVLAATCWALAGTLRHAPLRNGLLDHRGVAAIQLGLSPPPGARLPIAQAVDVSHGHPGE